MITKDMAKVCTDLFNTVNRASHVLIAGTTGSGKSVCLNTIIYSILKMNFSSPSSSPRFVMIDPKRVELKMYKKSTRCLIHVTEPEDIALVLNNCINVMDERYDNMEGRKSTEFPIYIIIDELADLLDTYGVLQSIIKIGRLGRAANIHLICCTQDPSRYTLSAQLMQNFNTCIALRCKSAIESKQIIGEPGAERLPRYGKAIVSDPDGMRVIDIPMTPDKDIEEVLESIRIFDQYVDTGAKGPYPEGVIEEDLRAIITERQYLEEVNRDEAVF